MAAFMTAYCMRSITVNELEGFRDAMLELCLPADLGTNDVVDLCGTGGDGKDTFNISTLASFVVAGAGYKVAKHGNYGVSSGCGSSNVMEFLGARFTNDSDTLKRNIDGANICFLHAPLFHPAMKTVAPIRRELGVKTFFNMLGPMVNPAKPKNQLVGVFNLELARATGLLYGRFSRPSAQIAYSKNILVAPYLENGRGVMFRLANLRRNILIDLEVEIIFSFNETLENGKTVRRFYPLDVERRKVSMLTINWTVVHPLDDNSPLKDMTKEDLEKTEAGFAILLRAFDDTFSQTVHSRTSYQYHEIVWGAKFMPVFDRDQDGRIVLDLSKISDHELVS